MKILVCLSKTPDTTAKVSFKENNTQFEENGVQFIINPYDEWYALVRAIELKEADPTTVLHVVFVGLADTDPIIRKALALGGDEAFRINLKPNDSFEVAFQIADLFNKNGGYDLILTGKETIDYNGNAVSGFLAELLQIQDISLAIQLTVNNQELIVEREIEGGTETIQSTLPVLVSCQKGMAEQRIPNMRNITLARTKLLKIIEPISFTPQTKTENFELPPAKTGVKIISKDNIEELVQLLHNEAKVI